MCELTEEQCHSKAAKMPEIVGRCDDSGYARNPPMATDRPRIAAAITDRDIWLAVDEMIKQRGD